MEPQDSTPKKQPQQCVICGRDFISSHSGQITCLRKECQTARKNIQGKQRRDADPVAFHAYQARYRKKNREKIIAWGRAYYATHKDQERERRNKPEALAMQKIRNKEWKAAHPERVRELGLADYYRHKDKRNAFSKAWYARRKAESKAAQQEVLELSAKLEAAQKRVEKFEGGKNRKDEEASKIDKLLKLNVEWSAITAQLNKESGTTRTKEAYMNNHRRWLKRPQN